jgi:sodium/hydrogen exchanger-like protein 6/7
MPLECPVSSRDAHTKDTQLIFIGIVSLLFCGMCMKHYAYHNMSRRTQLATKFVFQTTAQLSENFIFIYLGLSLFTERKLVFKPLFILVTIVAICVARYAAVFPLSKAINIVYAYRARRRGIQNPEEELPSSHQVMLFWAGLRGAVGVALAAGITGDNAEVLKATVLIVVVLTVIIFGGTSARMLEILNIRTGVVEEIDSDDEFDIEYISPLGAGTTFSRKSGNGIGHTPRFSDNNVQLGDLNFEDEERHNRHKRDGFYSSGNANGSKANGLARRESSRHVDSVEQGLLSPDILSGSPSQETDDDLLGELDLPPAARRNQRPGPSPVRDSPSGNTGSPSPYPTSGARANETRTHSRIANATGAITQLITGLSEDPGHALRMIDEDFIKPHLLLDPGHGSGNGHGNGHGNGGSNV